MEFRGLSKKALILALSNLFVMPVMASPFDGFNIEVLGGTAILQAKTHVQTETPAAQLTLPPPFPTFLTEIFNHRDTLSTDYGIGELRLGYGRVLCNSCFFIGGDIFGNYSQPEFDSHHSYTQLPLDVFPHRATIETARIKLNSFEYGIDLKPGYLLTSKTLLVGRIGAAFNKIKIHDSSEVLFPNDDFDVFNFANKEENKTGLLLGLGLEQYICHGFSLNLDYTYTDYGHVSVDQVSDITVIVRPAGFVDVPGGVIQHVDTRIHTNKIMLGLNYHFQPCITQSYDCCGNYCVPVFRGFYIGLSAGDLNTRANINGDTAFIIVTGGDADGFNHNADIGHDSFIGEVAVGYGLQFNRFYLGAQAFFNEADRHMTSNKDYTNGLVASPIDPNQPELLQFPTNYNNISAIHMSNGEYGADIMPGFLLTPCTLATLRVGAAINNVELRSFNHYDNVPDIGFFVENDLETIKSRHEKGLRLGLGLRQMICGGLSVTADYIYTDYGRIHTAAATDSFALGGAGIVTIPEGFTDDSRVHVTSQAVLLGLNYRFGGC